MKANGFDREVGVVERGVGETETEFEARCDGFRIEPAVVDEELFGIGDLGDSIVGSRVFGTKRSARGEPIARGAHTGHQRRNLRELWRSCRAVEQRD